MTPSEREAAAAALGRFIGEVWSEVLMPWQRDVLMDAVLRLGDRLPSLQHNRAYGVAGSDDAIKLPCRECGAGAGERCRYPDGGMCTSRVPNRTVTPHYGVPEKRDQCAHGMPDGWGHDRGPDCALAGDGEHDCGDPTSEAACRPAGPERAS